MRMTESLINEIPDFYKNYVRSVKHLGFLEALKVSTDETNKIISPLSNEKGLYKYEENKWTINELLQHITDADMVFTYRCLWIVRNAKGDLQGFDQDIWVKESNANDLDLKLILRNFNSTRSWIIDFFSSIREEHLTRSAIANGYEIKALFLPYIMSGHCMHHLKIIQERYLV